MKIKKIIKNHFNLNYKQFIKYILTSIICTILNISLYFVLFKVTDKRLVSNIIVYIITLTISFILNKEIVFKNKTKNKKLILLQSSIFILVRLSSLLIDSWVLLFSVHYLNLSDLISKILSNACTGINNYLFNKLLVFKERNNK